MDEGRCRIRGRVKDLGRCSVGDHRIGKILNDELCFNGGVAIKKGIDAMSFRMGDEEWTRKFRV